MDIQTRKIEFIQKFLKVESEDVINRLEKFYGQKTKLLKKKNLSL